MATTKSKKVAKQSTEKSPIRILDARPDSLDFRDLMYIPTLVEVPSQILLSDYQKHGLPVLDQGAEGACTGFGLATVVNYLLSVRRIAADPTPSSPRMLYEMARRYDEWPGESYSGSSARGAMKGWHKHGVCAEAMWPYQSDEQQHNLNEARIGDALKRPLGAYFRVNHKNLVAMHAALAEVGILYATAFVHEGWIDGNPVGPIPYSEKMIGGHAFAIVAYDAEGFWIQNSWGTTWGLNGLGRISYDEWLQNGTDVWVARLGVAINLTRTMSLAATHADTAGQSAYYSFPDLRPHIISVGNDGNFENRGNYATSKQGVATLFEREIPLAVDSKGYRHLMLYAHGGLVEAQGAVQRVADYLPRMQASKIYPLSFVWHSDYWSTIKNILQDAFSRRRPEGVLDMAKDFMLDRLDDALEPLARMFTGKAAWDEMKENALRATTLKSGAGYFVCQQVGKLVKKYPDIKVHLVGHSAGSIFLAPMVAALNSEGVTIESTTLWAPACTIELFKQYYLPALGQGIKRTAFFVLSDQVEQDDHCANIYHKSLLYLVSNAFEDKPRIPLFREGEPLLGMQKFLIADEKLSALFKSKTIELVISPNAEDDGSVFASGSRTHGGFDDDSATVNATILRMLGKSSSKNELRMGFHRSASSLRERRIKVDSKRGI
jgi:hypothetical protein